MVQKYLDSIKPFDPKSWKGGVCILTDEYRFDIHENVYKYEFVKLYSNLFISFYNIGHLSHLKIDKSIIDRQINTLSKMYHGNMSDSDRIWVNQLYVSELKEFTPYLFDLYYQYMVQFYRDIIDKYNIIYVDTDYLISKEEIDISEIGLKYEKTDISYFWIGAMKKFIIHDGVNLKTKGIVDKEQIDLVSSRVKGINRDNKLKSLLSFFCK